MHPDLVRLDAANRLDRQLLGLKNDKRKLDEALAAAKKAAEDAAADHVRLTEEDTANTERQRDLNRSIEKYEARKRSAERVLEGGGGDPEAAERQLKGVGEQLDLLETDLLECMEKADQLADSLVTAANRVAETKATHTELADAHGPAVEKLRAEFNAIVPQRDAELAELDHHSRDKYIAMRDRKGYAVAPIVGGACKACRMVLQQQHIADLKRGLLIPCRGCGRWLVPEESG